MSKQNLYSFLKKFNAGEYESSDVEVQIEAGWYDWFCKDSSLKNKTKHLTKKLMQIQNSSKIDLMNHYVFFKNNRPVNGSLYDDFRICDIETGDVVYTIVPSCGHKSIKGKAEVWGKENGFKEALVRGSWSDVKKFFNK